MEQAMGKDPPAENANHAAQKQQPEKCQHGIGRFSWAKKIDQGLEAELRHHLEDNLEQDVPEDIDDQFDQKLKHDANVCANHEGAEDPCKFQMVPGKAKPQIIDASCDHEPGGGASVPASRGGRSTARGDARPTLSVHGFWNRVSSGLNWFELV